MFYKKKNQTHKQNQFKCISINTCPIKSVFTCNQDEISSRDETRPQMKKFLCTREFHPGMKREEFHPRMKFNLKENLSLSLMKTIKFLIFLNYSNQ